MADVVDPSGEGQRPEPGAPEPPIDPLELEGDSISAAAQDNGLLGVQVVHGLRWSFINQVVNRVLTFASGVVVLRVLSVDEVGVFAIAAAVTAILMAFNEFGLIPAIVQWQGDHHKAAGTAYTIALANSTLLCLVVVLAAPWIADFSGSPRATGVIQLMALTIVIDGFTSIPLALLVREFNQKALAIAETTGLVAQSLLVVGLALAGFGAYSLAIGMVLSNVLVAVMLFAVARMSAIPQWRREYVRPLLKFGAPIAGSSVLRDAAVNLDKIAVGAMLGPRQLGYYQTAFNFSSLPLNTLGQIVGRVAFAGFARLVGEPERLDRSVRQSWVLMLAVLAPMVALIAALAEPIIAFVYGDKWIPAAAILSILVVMNGTRVMFMLAADVISASGRPRTEFRLYVTWTAILIPAFILGARIDGIRGVALAQLLVVLLVVIPLVLRALRPTGVQVRPLVLGSIRPVVAGIAAGLTAWPVGIALAATPFVACVAGGLVGGIVFLVVLLPANHDLDLGFVRKLLGRGKQSNAGVPA